MKPHQALLLLALILSQTETTRADRQGNLVGTYDKIHPYSPEINEQGITPGTRVPVFQTDFGRLGFMICYDSWFPDVAQLVSLEGADTATLDMNCSPSPAYNGGTMYSTPGDFANESKKNGESNSTKSTLLPAGSRTQPAALRKNDGATR